MPDIDVHASTQMSIHNLQGVLALQTLGFKKGGSCKRIKPR